MRIEMEIPTQAPYSLTYVDGMLYVVSADGKYKCPMDEGEQDKLWSDLLGGLFPSGDSDAPDGAVDDESLFKMLSDLLEVMDVTALFRDTNVSVDAATGVTTVTLCGISPEIQEVIYGALDSMEQDTTLPDAENTAMESLDFLRTLLKSVDMNDMTVTLTADKDMLLESYTLSAPVDMDGISDLVGDLELIPGLGSGAIMPMDTTLTLSTVIERGDQTVTVPEDADAYEETDLDTLFWQQKENESTDGSEAVG
jgi:hypothetical protein